MSQYLRGALLDGASLVLVLLLSILHATRCVSGRRCVATTAGVSSAEIITRPSTFTPQSSLCGARGYLCEKSNSESRRGGPARHGGDKVGFHRTAPRSLQGGQLDTFEVRTIVPQPKLPARMLNRQRVRRHLGDLKSTRWLRGPRQPHTRVTVFAIRDLSRQPLMAAARQESGRQQGRKVGGSSFLPAALNFPHATKGETARISRMQKGISLSRRGRPTDHPVGARLDRL